MAPKKSTTTPAPAASTWGDTVEDEDETPTVVVAPAGPRGKKTRAVLAAPSFSATKLNRVSKIDAPTTDLLFRKALRKYPNKFKLRLVNALAKSADNPLYERHMEDLESLKTALVERVDDPFPEVETVNVNILAAYMGCTDVKPAPQCVSDSTLGMEVAGIHPSQRQLNQLCAYRAVPPLLSESGAVTCYCGKPAAFKQQRSYSGDGAMTLYYACMEGRCRLWISTDALTALGELMDTMGVSNIPEFFCPRHPDKLIKIVVGVLPGQPFGLIDPQMGLLARCSWYNRDVVPMEFCCTEVLGPEGNPALTTGEPVWKTLDILSR